MQIAVKPKSAIDFARHLFMDFDQDNAIELWLYLLFFSRFQEKQKPIWLNCNFVLQVLPFFRYDLSCFTPFLLEDALLQTGILSFPREAETYLIKL